MFKFERVLSFSLPLALVSGVAAIGCLALGASSASAIVHVDPDGPAGQQYALPLDAVRGESAGNPSAGVPGSATSAPLFGQGIRPEGERAGSGKATHGGDGSPSRSDGKDYPAASGKNVAGADLRENISELVNGSQSGTSTTLQMILLIGGMTVLGLTAGLIARRNI